MKTLGKNADNDLYLEAGGLAILHDAEAQCAVIESVLQTQQGELQFDPDGGIDYFGTVFQNPTYIDFWAGQVQDKISALDFVESIEDFTYRFDAKTSTLYWSMTVINTEDERLDLQNKKTVITGSPGIDVSWNDIYDKPIGVQQALDMVEAMHEEAVDTREQLTSSSTLRDTKGLLNKIIFDPNNEDYAKTRLVTFTFSGVPLGTVIDFSNIRLDIANTGSGEEYYAPFIVEIDDGLKVRADQTITVGPTGNQIVFLDSERGQDEEGHPYTTQRHTLTKGGTITVTIKGNITGIWCADETKPIFLTSKGKPFSYLSAFTVGERVPLAMLGNGAFQEFNNLQKVVWDEGTVDSITFGEKTFAGCSSLMEISWIPTKVTYLGVGCFENCKSLLSLKGLESTLVNEIPDDCFYGCTQLKTCGYLPESLTRIGAHVFKGCTTFKNIDELPQSVEELGVECFCGCTGITAILYPPEALKTIGKRCFADCTAMESLYISENVQTISDEAFAGCTALTNIMSDAAAVPTTSASAFTGEMPIVYVPKALLQDYLDHSVWSAFTVKKYGVYKFFLENIGAKTTILGTTSNLVSDSIWTITYGIGDKQQRFIPSVDSLPEFTYAEAVAEATITIKGYVRRLSAASAEAYPFLATAQQSPFNYLTEVEVKDSPLEMIGDYAFAQCQHLRKIDCGFEEEREYCLGERAFWGCQSLADTDWLKAGLGELVKEVQTTYEQEPDGTIVPIETTILYPAFGDRCFWQSGISVLEYAADAVTSLPPYCFAETDVGTLDGIGGVLLSELGDHCFYKCAGLDDISALANTNVKTLPDYCFAECGSLESIVGVANLESSDMGIHVFENSGVKSLLPISNAASITEIAPYMFKGCDLETLEGLTAKITALGENCFADNGSLSDISKLLDTSVTEIPIACFQNCKMPSLIGCWNITSIGDYAFAGCTSLIATSGLGAGIDSIGNYAFQGCTGLKQVSCLALVPPPITSTTFTGVTIGAIPLYVREDVVSQYASATTWNKFARVASRTIKVHLQNVGGDGVGDLNISAEDANSTGVRVSIDPSGNHALGVWYVDYGDDTPFEHFYANGETIYNALSEHDFKVLRTNDSGEEELLSTRGNYTVTLFGDIIEVWGSHSDEIVQDTFPHIEPVEDMSSPFLRDTLAQMASSIEIKTEYLRKVGNFCFYNYGRPAGLGNENTLTLSLAMNESGEVGHYAFAKYDSGMGPIGTTAAFNAVYVGDYAFWNCGLDSSANFGTVKTAGAAAFGKNPLISDLSGFSSLTAVPIYMFKDCTGITTTSGLQVVTEIGAFGFSGCSGLTAVKDFNDRFSQIGNYAFEGCPNITRIFMANVNPPTLPTNGFEETVFQNAVVYVPAGYETKYQTTDYWSKFASGVEGRIRSRSITFTLTNVPTNGRTANGMGIVTATGNWVLSYGEGEQSFQFKAGETTIPSYTFKRGGTKTVKISGPVTGIKCTASAYPIFGQSVGNNPWLTHVEASDAMEISEIGDYLFRGCSALQSITDVPSVVSVGEYSFADTGITDVTGLSNVASIEQYAFAGCSSLTSLYGFDSVTTIGERAFNGCSSLKRIDGLGTTIATIGEYAFASCPLEEVQVFAAEPPTVAATAFNGLSNETPMYVRTKSLTAYKEDTAWRSLFSDISSRFVEFTLTACPSNLTVRGDSGKVKSNTYWVVDWDAYESSGVPSKVGLGEQALPAHTYALSGNHTLRIEGAVTYIGCDEPTIDGVSYPYEESGDTIVPNGESSFSGYSFLTLENNGTILDGESHLLTRVSRSDRSVLSEVGPSAFLRNKRLSAVYLAGISKIGAAAFAYDTEIDNLALLDVVGEIDKFAFYGCSGLSSVTSLNGKPDIDGIFGFTIADYAFGGIPNLTYIQVGVPLADNAKITNLSFGEFDSPEAQKAVYVYVPLESVSSYTGNAKWNKFTIASQVLTFTMLHVPTGTTIQGISETNSAGTARVESDSRWTVDWDDGTMNTMESRQTSFPSHTYLYDDNADALEKERWETINGVKCRKKIEISITGSIKSLSCQSSSNYPFLATGVGIGNPYLTSVAAPESMASLTALGDFVFQDCTALESITGFGHVKSIGQYAFNGCTSLTNIGDAESGFKAVTSIGNKAFANCSNLQNLASFASVLTIGIRAFENCISITGTTGMGSAYSALTPADWSSRGLSASFGAYAFDGCTFGAIDMDNYNVPPTIQNSTFPGDPSDVLVFVSLMDGVLETYKAAPVWMRYFENIIAASNITLQFGENEIQSPTRDSEGRVISGTAIYGGNGKLAFADAYVLIDWGDGTTTQSVSKYSDVTDGWTFPNHLYTKDVSGSVTVRIRGNISRIYTADGNDAALSEDADPDIDMKPFLALSTFNATTTTDPETDTTTTVTQITNDRRYDYKLQRISFGNGSRLTRIGTYCFANCNIGSVEFGKPTAWTETIKDDAGHVIESIYHDGTIEIGDCAFWNCGLTTAITSVSGAISAVGKFSFNGCVKIPNVDFLSGCRSIGVKAFKDCIGLESINLPSTLLSVTTSAFEGCYSIKEGINWEQATDAETLANGNITIGNRAFYGCTGANNEEWSVSLPSQVHSIGMYAFTKCGMKSFSWGSSEYPSTNSTYTMADGDIGVFEKCANLASVSILTSLDEIPLRAFCNCESLASVSGMGSVATIRPYAFFGCTSLSDDGFAAIIAHASGTIGQYAFAKCSALTTISLPSTVAALGEGCFNRSSDDFLLGNYSEDENFTAEEFPEFYGLDDYETWMTEHFGKSRFDKWGKYDSFLYVSSTNALPLTVSWARANGSLGAGCFMNCQTLAIDWDNFPSLTQVPAYCFYNCTSLFAGGNLSVLPATITYFGRFALARTGMTGIGRGGETAIAATLAPALFLGCNSLESLGDEDDGLKTLFATIPSAIPDGCFYGCTELADIGTLAADVPNIKRLGQYCFANCTKLSGRGEHNISNALAEITQLDDGCFMGCAGLTKLDGLAKVTHYPYRAFYGCSSLATITRLCSAATAAAAGEITLEGDSFGGISNIWKISLPYATFVVDTEVASGIDEEGHGFQSDDPFSGLTKAQKSRVFVEVPSDIVVDYNNDSYWNQFAVTTPIGDLIPAVQMKLKVPAGGGTVYCNGGVVVVGGDQVIIDWGDGSDMIAVTQGAGDTSISLAGISHEYLAEEFVESTVITLTLFGKVTAFYGKADDSATSVVKNKTIVPIISTTEEAQVPTGTGMQAENTWIEEVSFPGEYLQEVGEGAFGNCPNLSSVRELPDTVVSIGNNAFFGCTSIANLNFLPTTLTSLGKYCFAYCTGLRNFAKFKQCTGITAISDGCFNSISARTKTFDTLDWLPPNVTTIGKAAFQLVYFENFGVTTTNTNVIKVDSYAFRQNLSLTSLAGINIELVGTDVFRQCSALTSIAAMTLVQTNNKIPRATFRDCSSLASLSGLPSGITTLDNGAFYNTAITSLAGCPASVTKIGDTATSWSDSFESSIGGAFGNCSSLASLNGMPSSVATLGTAAFKGCSALTRLTNISENVTTIGDYCFAGTGLTDLDYLPTGIASLGIHCFDGCSSLEDLSGLDTTSLSTIPDYCFANCTSLKYIVENAASVAAIKALPQTVTRLGAYAFAGCTGLLIIKLGRGVVGSSDPITDLNDTDEAPTVFPYSTLASKSGFKIYVPTDVLPEYEAAWCTAHRFGDGFTLETY